MHTHTSINVICSAGKWNEALGKFQIEQIHQELNNQGAVSGNSCLCENIWEMQPPTSGRHQVIST